MRRCDDAEVFFASQLVSGEQVTVFILLGIIHKTFSLRFCCGLRKLTSHNDASFGLKISNS